MSARKQFPRRALLLALFSSSVATAAPTATRDALAHAERVVREHRLLTLRAQRCYRLVLRDGSGRFARVGVYEKHDERCGGDPNVEHRLFDLELDMKTGAAKWDNNFPEMEMRPVPPRRR